MCTLSVGNKAIEKRVFPAAYSCMSTRKLTPQNEKATI